MLEKFIRAINYLDSDFAPTRALTNRCFLHLFLTIFLFSIMGVKSFANPVDPKFYGDYIGLSLGHIHNGASYGESLIGMTVDKEGLHRTEFIGKYSFYVTYSPDWLINVRDSETLSRWFPKRTFGGSEYLAIRQSPESDLAQSILEYFSKFSFKWVATRVANIFRRHPIQPEVLEYLGEGMPMLLGVFTKKDAKGNAERNLKRAFEKSRELVSNEETESKGQGASWVLPINLADDLIALADQDISINAKFEIIRRAAHNISTGTPEEIAERVSILEYAIAKSNEPLLISEGLSSAQLGARVGAMAAIVSSALEASVDRITQGAPYWIEQEVIQNAVDAAAVQLYEVHRALSPVVELQKRFGTTDVKTIHSSTGGRVSAEDAYLLNEFEKVQAINAKKGYTWEDADRLTAALEKVKAIPVFSEEFLDERTVKDLNRALQDYPRSQLCSLRLSGQSE